MYVWFIYAFHVYVRFYNEPKYVRRRLDIYNQKCCTTAYGSVNEPKYVCFQYIIESNLKTNITGIRTVSVNEPCW
jgi:hypothetical protein